MQVPHSRSMLLLAACAVAAAGVGPPDAATATCGTADQRGCATPRRHAAASRGSSLVQRGRLLAPAVAAPEPPDEITFRAVVRDFTADHPDFQSFDGHFKGLVEDRLGPDGKPVFRGGPVLSDRASFDQWYRDVPGVNRQVTVPLTLKHSSHSSYVYDSASFFPVDGQGWNDTATALDGKPHNFYFTLELRSTFVYHGGEQFTFRGDDDVWVFIDNKLVIDLGGVHHPLEGTVSLDKLGLSPGTAVDFAFFFAERRCCGSNFRVETSLKFAPVWGSCVVWGDPHVSVFDRPVARGKEPAPVLGMFSSGDFWLVRSSLVSIQGRYGATPWTAPGLSALVSLAIGGPFLRNNTLIVEPMGQGGKVTWDGEEILQNVPSEFFIRGFVNLTFHGDDRRRLIDRAQEKHPLRALTAHLPANVFVTVNRWARHLDVIIAMSQQPGGQDGHCGNFNGDPLDDTKALIEKRARAPVLAGESLFPGPPPVGSEANAAQRPRRELQLEDCAAGVRAEAERLCRKDDAAAAGAVLDACVFDVCFAGRQYAEEDGIADRQARSA